MKEYVFKTLIKVLYFIGTALFNTGLSIYFGDVAKYMTLAPLFTVEGMFISFAAATLDFAYAYYKK